jgi:periplasmic protein TonB
MRIDWRDPDGRADGTVTMVSALRWTAAGLTVVALHAGGVWLALNWPAAAEAPGDPSAAIMMELAPLAVAPEIPQQDIAPGPEMVEAEDQPEPEKVEEEVEPEPTPQPLVETEIKPPKLPDVKTAEVVLPPKVEPPEPNPSRRRKSRRRRRAPPRRRARRRNVRTVRLHRPKAWPRRCRRPPGAAR